MATLPPSAAKTPPVAKLERSLARKRMICDISLGDAQRPSGIEAAIPSITPGPNDFMAAVTLSVLVGPTATALTRTLLSANSAAQYRVSESIAAFAEPYSDIPPGSATEAAVLLTLTMLPERRATIPGASFCTRKNAARTMVSYIKLKSSAVSFRQDSSL